MKSAILDFGLSWPSFLMAFVGGADIAFFVGDPCYAERMALRLKAMGQPKYANGFDLALHENALELPLKWKKPQTIFVNSMSDLFHKDVPVGFIAKTFDVMRRADWHVFQILTKRSDRLLELSSELPWRPHIWMGVSVETLNYTPRIDHLRQTGAMVKFLSLEPLLGPLPGLNLEGIDWVIVGSESALGTRPLDPRWGNRNPRPMPRRVPFFSPLSTSTEQESRGRQNDLDVGGRL